MNEDHSPNKPLSPNSPKSQLSFDKTRLRQILIDHFSQSELEEVCSDVQQLLAQLQVKLTLNLSIVGGDTLSNQALRLIEFLDRRRHLEVLVDVIRRMRPSLDWNDGQIASDTGAIPEST